MFSKTQPKIKVPPENKVEAPSIISRDMRVSGDLKSEGDIQVDGLVDGDIRSATLSIGRTAEVNGEVEADSVVVYGRVNGRIKGRAVTLQETAEINGDILHETLEVARGAYVEGMVKRERSPDASTQRPGTPTVNLVVQESGKPKPVTNPQS